MQPCVWDAMTLIPGAFAGNLVSLECPTLAHFHCCNKIPEIISLQGGKGNCLQFGGSQLMITMPCCFGANSRQIYGGRKCQSQTAHMAMEQREVEEVAGVPRSSLEMGSQ